LDAVRKLHLVCLLKLADLLPSLGFSFKVSQVLLLPLFYARVVGEFVLFEVCELVLARRKAPSSNRPIRVLRIARLGAAYVWGFRGGIRGWYC
jgi:hypothetical protein